MAFLEASLLFAEAGRNADIPLPALSERISFAILRVADALATVMEAHAQENDLWPMVNAQLPPALAASEHAPKLPKMLPWEYQKSVSAPRFEYPRGIHPREPTAVCRSACNRYPSARMLTQTIVKSLASRLVYREGLTFVESMPDARLPMFALSYLEQEQRIQALAAEVASSGHAFAPKVEALLLQSGVRVAAEEQMVKLGELP